MPGYTSSRKRQKDFTAAIVERTGASALVVDYSGHGDSPFELKDTKPAQHFLEVICAFDWLRGQCADGEISVIGSSYGGFLGTQLTKYREFNKLVLRAPAIYEPSTFYDLWSARLSNEASYRTAIEAYRRDSEALEKHPLLARASQFKGEVLVAVHENDEIIPQETTDAYIKAFGAESFVAEGFSHAVSQSPISQQQLDDYQGRIADWLSDGRG